MPQGPQVLSGEYFHGAATVTPPEHGATFVRDVLIYIYIYTYTHTHIYIYIYIYISFYSIHDHPVLVV